MELDELIRDTPPPAEQIVEGVLVVRSGARWARVDGQAALWGPLIGGDGLAAGATIVLALVQDGTPYVIWPATVGGALILYLAPTEDSDIAGYKKLLATPSPHPESTIAAACTGTDDVPIEEFATEAGFPGATAFPAGTAFRRFYVRTSAGTARLHYKVFVRSAAGAETLVRDEYSPDFTNTAVELVEWLATPPSGGVLSATDRIVNKLYAQRVAGPTNITVTAHFEGSAHGSHVQTTIPVGARSA
jgi:hypothetical protein